MSASSMRVQEPDPCTAFAHHWPSGSVVCQCGEATRDGNCRGRKTASRLTDAQIYEAVTGHAKPVRVSPRLNPDALTFEQIGDAARSGIISYQDAFDAVGNVGEPDRDEARRRVAAAIELQRERAE